VKLGMVDRRHGNPFRHRLRLALPARTVKFAWADEPTIPSIPQPANGDHAGSDASVGVDTGRSLKPVISIDTSRDE